MDKVWQTRVINNEIELDDETLYTYGNETEPAEEVLPELGEEEKQQLMH